MQLEEPDVDDRTLLKTQREVRGVSPGVVAVHEDLALPVRVEEAGEPAPPAAPDFRRADLEHGHAAAERIGRRTDVRIVDMDDLRAYGAHRGLCINETCLLHPSCEGSCGTVDAPVPCEGGAMRDGCVDETRLVAAEHRIEMIEPPVLAEAP